MRSDSEYFLRVCYIVVSEIGLSFTENASTLRIVSDWNTDTKSTRYYSILLHENITKKNDISEQLRMKKSLDRNGKRFVYSERLLHFTDYPIREVFD